MQNGIYGVLGVTTPPAGYHDLEFWAHGIAEIRKNGLPVRTHGSRPYGVVVAMGLPVGDQTALLEAARRLMTNWSVSDRYKSLQRFANKTDLEDVFEDAVTIRRLYSEGRI